MNHRLPPRAARALLDSIVPASHVEDVAEDLVRAYQKRLSAGWGGWRVDLWYWSQVLAPDTFRLASLLRARDKRRNSRVPMKIQLDSLLQDIRYTLRAFSRRPVWTAAIVCTLALGLGATTAAFSIVYGVMLKPLPFENPDELMAVRRGDRWGWETVSFPVFEDLKRKQQVFDEIGVWSSSRRTLSLGDRPEQMSGAIVSAELFPTLGAQPAIGRWFAQEDDLENAHGVIILSHLFWKNRFGGEESVLGRSVIVNDRPHTVVGVMPEGFAFPTAATQFWESLAFASRERNRFYLRPIGRLRPGVGRTAAQEHIAGTEWVIPADGEAPERVVPLQAMTLLAYSVRDAPTTLLFFQGAAIAVLLIACLNVTGLLLVRTISRGSEVALRAALGAGQARLARLTLTETALLGLMGGAVGIAAAFGLLRLSLSAIPGSIPMQERISLGAPVIGVGLLLAVGVGTVIGLLPAFRTAQVDLRRSLGGTGLGLSAGKARNRTWSVLVSAQIALAVLLLVGGGLLLKSFVNLRSVDPGFDPEHVLIANIPITRSGYADQASRKAFYDELARRLEALPQVRSAAVVGQAPFTGWSDGASQVEGASGVVEDVGYTEFQRVGPGYFETLDIPVLAGRDFDARDGAEDALVAIVNETYADRHFQAGDPLGGRIRTGRGDEDPWMTIVGVVGDIKHIDLEAPLSPQIYMPYSVSSSGFRMPLAIRTAGDPLLLVGALRETVGAMDPNIPVPATYVLESGMEGTMADERFQTWILGSFAATALLLAMLGVYSVVAHTVTLRTREFGIRKALGATERRVVSEVVSGSAFVIVSGLCIGLVAAYALAGVTESFLFGIQARDPALFVTVTIAMGAVAVLATYFPARRAGRSDPVESIRAE